MTIAIRSQRGVALLTILLLVVSITVVAGAMLASQKIVIRRSGLLFNQNQLLQDIDAAQQLAVTLVRADSMLNDTDSLQDIWAQPLPPYPLASHTVTMELRDEAARFNINNLYHDGKVDAAALGVFQRLLTQLNLDPKIAIAALDWQDRDREVYKDGGEEGVVYAQQGTGLSAALPNQPFVSVDQLQDLPNMSAEGLAVLRPYLTAVPYYLPINVNTASPEMLAALVDGISAQQIQGLESLQKQQVIESVDNIWQQPPLNAVSTEQRQLLTPLLAVDSQAFLALITATDSANLGAARQKFATVLISKIEDSNGDNTETNNDGNNDNNANNNEDSNKKPAKTIKVVSQRLWAFEPTF
ncbi:type II secretion system minor pseudopilin GspK [Psychrobacter sp. 1U2]|uniref:type II secretion system minor pseudopilin GspK n=1 Tax=Psychrobacter sp. 1U2 TaxID=3453577 RepID=UPI003F450C8C